MNDKPVLVIKLRAIAVAILAWLLIYAAYSWSEECPEGLVQACVIPSVTKTQSKTPTPAATRTFTRTPRPAATATRTRIPTRTQTWTPTRAPSRTPISTRTPTLTRTRRPTWTPTVNIRATRTAVARQTYATATATAHGGSGAATVQPTAGRTVVSERGSKLRIVQVDLLPTNDGRVLKSTNPQWPLVATDDTWLPKIDSTVKQNMAQFVVGMERALRVPVEIVAHKEFNESPPIIPWPFGADLGMIDYQWVMDQTLPNWRDEVPQLWVLNTGRYRGAFDVEWMTAFPTSHYSEIPMASVEDHPKGYGMINCPIDRPVGFCYHDLGHMIEALALNTFGQVAYDDVVGTWTPDRERWAGIQRCGDTHNPPWSLHQYEYATPSVWKPLTCGSLTQVRCTMPGEKRLPDTWACGPVNYEPPPMTATCLADPLRCGDTKGHGDYLLWMFAHWPERWWNLLLDFNAARNGG